MTRSNPPFRAEHVGSLLRPRRLKDAAKGVKTGDTTESGYQQVLDEEVERVVKLQESVGLHSITDGEFSKSSWFGFFVERLDGFTFEPALFRFHDDSGHDHEWLTCYTNGKMRRKQPICVHDFERLQTFTRETPKANMPSPSALHFFRGAQCRDDAVYPDIEEWWSDLLNIYKAEIGALYDAGCRYIQLDEVPLAMLCDSDVRQQISGAGENPDELTRRYIAVTNAVLADRAEDLTVGMHLCRGNFRSRWMAQGGYEPVAERLFNDLDIDAFFLEYDSPRAGDFGPLRHMGQDKTVVLGLVTSKTAALENPDDLKRRIEDASQYVPLERLAISPQCGFASVAGGNELDEGEQMAKLELIVNVARDVWGDA
ncbi:MAG: 5-methyltetrahydropteroyltriglutamate--homocysteine S-methyltransferase [Woeseiaceae bacterium]|nr:5-methyltetrahydropteroyltriglutamate--homocysteine S-methyltransferase [Woeseiaceae bacterium]